MDVRSVLILKHETAFLNRFKTIKGPLELYRLSHCGNYRLQLSPVRRLLDHLEEIGTLLHHFLVYLRVLRLYDSLLARVDCDVVVVKTLTEVIVVHILSVPSGGTRGLLHKLVFTTEWL